MLKLTGRKPKNTFFKTGSVSRWKGARVKTICVAMTPQVCLIKWQGTRQVFALPWYVILDKAAEAHALAEKRRKAEEKAQRKGIQYKPRPVKIRRGRVG